MAQHLQAFTFDPMLTKKHKTNIPSLGVPLMKKFA